jgi:mRNA interferase MazF
MGSPMLRGEIRLADLDPARSGEASKRRPAVIVSNDRANASAARLGRGVVTIVPVTSNVEQVYPFQVLLAAEETGLRVDSKAQGEQIRSVSVERLGRCDRPGSFAGDGASRRRPPPPPPAVTGGRGAA